MSNVKFYQSIDMMNTVLVPGELVSATHKKVVFDALSFGYDIVSVYSGRFFVDSRGELDGVIRSITQFDYGQKTYSAKKVNVDAGDFVKINNILDAYELVLNGPDKIIGSNYSDRILGFSGNDVISGRSGDDELYGNIGRDTLKGDIGDDWLNGGPQNDILFGGPGRDYFEFDSWSGVDTVRDFKSEDTIVIDRGRDSDFFGARLRDVDIVDGKKFDKIFVFDHFVAKVFGHDVEYSDIAFV
ncbi:hypothetical protein L1787_12610 [Acuticoccus sp. M5D2P5]|uniref:calcium-binding protein n=1 Tax=Acuticoccus kalidii TaxID=2910977 RepID=UPI001F2BEB30|nr:hypothetical protein [Acuticoccus kalidii]MCF3934250.1 hypothetical protein [Acuticoccus kalidii]